MNIPENSVRNVALVVPLLLVNAAAIYGQVMWAEDHLPRLGFAGALGFACALESIGIFLAAEAHASLMAGDSSARLRLGSYGVALLVGALNYAHFAPALDQPNPQALAFGAMSVISPWLWAIRSRSMSRAQLREQGLIDGRAVKFTAIQWALYPRRSFAAFRGAVWAGETNPDRARALTEPPFVTAQQIQQTRDKTRQRIEQLAELPPPPVLPQFEAPRMARIGRIRSQRRPGRLAGHPRAAKPVELDLRAAVATALPASARIPEQTIEPAALQDRPQTTTAQVKTRPAKTSKTRNSAVDRERALQWWRSELAQSRRPSGGQIAQFLGASRATGSRLKQEFEALPS